MFVSQTRHSNVLVLLLRCTSGPPGPLSILVRASLRCSVMGVVHGVRLTSFKRKLFVSGHFEPVIEPTNADAPDTQLV